MALKDDSSINVLWQNLIALNASLAKENEEKREQLISTENMLQEEIQKTMEVRTKMEEQFLEHEKELSKKNRKIARLTSKLEMVKQLTKRLFTDDDSDTAIEEDQKQNLKSISTKQSSDQNSSSNQRKIPNFFITASPSKTKLELSTEEFNNPETTYAVEMNSDFTENAVDREEIKEENLLVPLESVPYKSPKKKVCDECGRKFTSLISFQRHGLMHSELRKKKFTSQEQQLICSKCPKTSKDSGALKRHMSIHSDQRPFACSKCLLAFRRSDHLKNHVKNVHMNADLQSDDNSFSCTMCPKTFSQLQFVVHHKRIQHEKAQHKKKRAKKDGTKHFSCDECDRNFSYIHNLNRHKRNVHGQK